MRELQQSTFTSKIGQIPKPPLTDVCACIHCRAKQSDERGNIPKQHLWEESNIPALHKQHLDTEHEQEEADTVGTWNDVQISTATSAGKS